MAVIHPQWEGQTSSYDMNQEVRDDGVLYKARRNVAADVNNERPCNDETNWRVVGVLSIQSENSLVEAIKLELNATGNERINNSIPLFMQLAHESFKTRIRAPISRAVTVVPTDADGSILVPDDLQQVINLRLSDVSNNSGTIFGRAGSQILAAQNYQEFIDLRRYYSEGLGLGSIGFNPSNYTTMVYWFDNESFQLAPSPEMGTMVELRYYAGIPRLGTYQNLVDDNGDPINEQGQTITEWVAAGNPPSTFVQATERVTRNWYVAVAPQLLLYGSILAGETYLKDDDRLPMWRQKYQAAEAEVHDYIDTFEQDRAHTQQLFNAYTR